MVAAIRTASWEWPLFVHVGGAMVLVATLLAVVLVQLRAAGGRSGTGAEGLAFKILLLGVVPSYVVMRLGAQWVYDREGWNKVPDTFTPSWLDTGFLVSDGSAVLLLVALVTGGIAARRARHNGGLTLERIAAVLATVVLAAYVVAVWAMTTKPS